jgi:uncharacterized membrane protein YeaQ/YmgE (transglycosylase-associated protein family)
MSVAGFVAVLVVGGFVVGAMARLAVPGPDPLPVWATGVLGVAGSLVAGLVTWTLAGAPPGLLSALVASVLILVLYRRVVQKRGITGPEAKKAPTRGWWLPPPRRVEPPTPDKLERLRKAGAISQDEYESLQADSRDRH